MTLDEVMAQLQKQANQANLAGMARVGINTQDTLGISVYDLRRMAKEIGIDHELAEQLWASGIHEAQLLAVFVADPRQVTPQLMESWAADFDSWDLCDQACTSLFDLTPHAHAKALEWSQREDEFVRRAGFAIMAGLAVHDKEAGDEQFEPFFVAILGAAGDGRNYVKKAVNWALRNIGKRNRRLNARAVQVAAQVAEQGSPCARWIAADARRELTAEKVQKRLQDEVK